MKFLKERNLATKGEKADASCDEALRTTRLEGASKEVRRGSLIKISGELIYMPLKAALV